MKYVYSRLMDGHLYSQFGVIFLHLSHAGLQYISIKNSTTRGEIFIAMYLLYQLW